MIKIVIFMKRKPGLSREEFRDYYENNHIPLITRHFGEYQADYRRSYFDGSPPFGLAGVPPPSENEVPAFDVLTEIWCKDRETMEAMLEKCRRPDLAKLVADDEAKFIDRPSVRLHLTDEYPQV